MQQGKLELIFKSVRYASGVVGGGFHRSLFEEIISLPNLFAAWREFSHDKKKKKDVLAFAPDTEEQIFLLHDELKDGRYRHGGYESFMVSDPKPRRIHKASVRDRLLHHAVHRVLYPYFDKIFIYDSYSSRKNKGTHVAIRRFRDFAWKLSRNRTRTVWVFKADVKKFFDSVNHAILASFLKSYLPSEPRLLSLLCEIIGSFHSQKEKGIPLGNLTSQLFSNIYLNHLDQFVKRELRVRYYIRYADDILILSPEEAHLKRMLVKIEDFINDELRLELHPAKIQIKKWHNGVDVLGFVSYPSRTVMRPKTLRRMVKRLVKTSNISDFETQQNAIYARMKFER